MKNSDTCSHVRGESRYTDDYTLPQDTLHCVLLYSPVARGKITRLDCSEAEKVPGVFRILKAEDIPGENQIGTIILDEVLLAEKEVHYVGQPVAALYGETEEAARTALQKIDLQIEEEEALVDPREAFRRGEILTPPRTFCIGNVEEALKSCAYVVEGRAESGAQEHFYLEGQAAVSYPIEGERLYIRSSTQAPTTVQKVVARVCGLPMQRVEVDVRRLGGGFGGKEDQANAWACFAALGSRLTGHPCRCVLRRNEDMKATGKRHPYSSDFTMGLDTEGRILAYKAFFYQNSGAAADLSTAILERTLFHGTASYRVPHVEMTAVCCRTNLAPFTAFRGFGGPQAMFVYESALRSASAKTGIPIEELQRKNLIGTGDIFPYGQKAESARAKDCWDRAFELYGLQKRIQSIKEEKAGRYGRGYALMPVCFGISFTNISLNQARALIHLYQDGSVGVSTGAVEMGQGVNQKIKDIVSLSLGIPEEKISLESSNTTRVANSSATAASSGSDLNGMAARMACRKLTGRLQKFLAIARNCDEEDLEFSGGRLLQSGKDTGLYWDQVILQAYQARVHLSAEAHYATPDLYFDKEKEKGRPFAYHSYGTAYVEATVDRLLGTYRIDLVQIVHDSGRNINPLVDLGQVEGGLAQGTGWMTMEEMRYSQSGKPLTASAGSYKVPDMFSAPGRIDCEFLQDADNPKAVLNSKAVGEPPFMYGIGAWFALQMAAGFETSEYIAPLTPERLFTYIHK